MQIHSPAYNPELLDPATVSTLTVGDNFHETSIYLSSDGLGTVFNGNCIIPIYHQLVGGEQAAEPGGDGPNLNANFS